MRICKKVVLVKVQTRSRYQLKVSCFSAQISLQPTSGALAVESFSTTACTVCVGDFESARGGLGVAEVIVPITAEFAPELAAVLQILRLVFVNLFPNNLDFLKIFLPELPESTHTVPAGVRNRTRLRFCRTLHLTPPPCADSSLSR